jgi:hypothetical protein
MSMQRSRHDQKRRRPPQPGSLFQRAHDFGGALPLNTIFTKGYVVSLMSTELKARLNKVSEEDHEQDETNLEAGLPRIKTLLLKIAQAKKFDVLIWMEGTHQPELEDEKDLGLLERANLIKGQTKYTHRNVYRQFELTKKGEDIAKQLSAET